ARSGFRGRLRRQGGSDVRPAIAGREGADRVRHAEPAAARERALSEERVPRRVPGDGLAAQRSEPPRRITCERNGAAGGAAAQSSELKRGAGGNRRRSGGPSRQAMDLGLTDKVA